MFMLYDACGLAEPDFTSRRSLSDHALQEAIPEETVSEIYLPPQLALTSNHVAICLLLSHG